ncbi:MAG: hypothetical protein JST16_12680 [Bdellovibrionales bacterium]|nr:hypothetical protein [Bdellovibrionales bacterium]
MSLARLLLVTGVFSCPAAHADYSPAPPKTWELWLQQATAPRAEHVPPRPDGQPLTAELPLWVDCHLSWRMDQPKLSKTSQVPSGVVLRSTPEKCKGQIEEWAH